LADYRCAGLKVRGLGGSGKLSPLSYIDFMRWDKGEGVKGEKEPPSFFKLL